MDIKDVNQQFFNEIKTSLLKFSIPSELIDIIKDYYHTCDYKFFIWRDVNNDDKVNNANSQIFAFVGQGINSWVEFKFDLSRLWKHGWFQIEQLKYCQPYLWIQVSNSLGNATDFIIDVNNKDIIEVAPGNFLGVVNERIYLAPYGNDNSICCQDFQSSMIYGERKHFFTGKGYKVSIDGVNNDKLLVFEVDTAYQRYEYYEISEGRKSILDPEYGTFTPLCQAPGDWIMIEDYMDERLFFWKNGKTKDITMPCDFDKPFNLIDINVFYDGQHLYLYGPRFVYRCDLTDDNFTDLKWTKLLSTN